MSSGARRRQGAWAHNLWGGRGRRRSPHVPNRSSTRKIDDTCHGFSCSWTSSYGFQRFFSNAASISDRSRDSVKGVFCAALLCDGPSYPVFPSLPRRLYRVQYVKSIDRLVWEPCNSYAVPCQELFHQRLRASFMPYAGFLRSRSNL